MQELQTAGYKVAIDEVDFRLSAIFLAEMERCVRQSRFTVAVISPGYRESGNCMEEAIISKVLDMSEQSRRLIPLTIKPVEIPIFFCHCSCFFL